jgi:photosystem II stability/assembly factor-like uncharacterized protein
VYNNLLIIKAFRILVTFQLLCILSFSQWTVVSNQGNEAVFFPSENTGYSTSNGITLKTTNGGFNWSFVSGGNLTGIFFTNNLTGWVVGYPGYIGKTTTGGAFLQQQTGISDRLNDVFFIDNNTGWVVGGDFGTERIFKTTNGGTNWIPQSSGTSNKLFAVHFIDANTGWSVGGPSAPKIIKTTNGGDNWITQTTTVNTPLYSVMFADANTGWAVAGYIGGETIIKTTNGGTNWFSQSSGDNRYLRQCFVLNSSTAFAVGQSGKIIKTTNGGNNWIIQPGTTIELWSVKFVNDTVGYAIGDNVVLKTTNGGLTFVNGSSNEIPIEHALYQNYPNPFNPVTDIGFRIAHFGLVKLEVYNALGQQITELVNSTMQPGNYKSEWDASNYPSGIYFYKIIINSAQSLPGSDGRSYGFIQTKKMVLIK